MIFKTAFIETIEDSIHMLPFLFVAFLLIEFLEKHTSEKTNEMLKKAKKAGPILGAIVGCVPQCGFSIMAANLYAGGVVSLGTLISVWISTSDEALLILLGNKGQLHSVLKIIIVKVIFGIIFGYLVDFIIAKFIESPKESGVLCVDCGCEESGNIFMPALRHTVKLFLYLVVLTFLLNVVLDLIGTDGMSKLLLGKTYFEPLITGIIGAIPNCTASVLLMQMYILKIITFPSVIAGLTMNSGLGMLTLFRENKNRKENIKIVVLLYGISCLIGFI
ncbi:MAG: arsenic efflux protein, partial [Lachnospiraceae bacterium]|nr:arsenic efflux protein [Lachnospiraceae bacterium]